MKKRKKLGVALGSGGPRGLYHIGVLKALKENGVPIDYLAGSSIGAWIGGHYALHEDIEKLEEFSNGHKFEKMMGMLEFSLSGGLIKGNKLQKLLDDWLHHAQFKNLKIPFRAVVTDLASGEPVIMKSGNLAIALRASMAVPGAFAPVAYKGKTFIDGGISDPVPDDLVRKMGADVILAVDLMYEGSIPPAPSKKREPTIAETMQAALDILCRQLSIATTRDADIVLRPHLGRYASWSDYFLKDKGEEIIALGYKETKKIIPALRRKLEA